MPSTYLTRATSDPQSSNTTATFSVWIKRTALGSDQTFWGGSYYSTDNMFLIKFASDDKLQVYSKRGASVKASLKTTRLLKDTNSWYHIVVAIDTTQGTASNRIKVYINGVQETSFSTNTQPSQNENLYLDSGAGANYYIGQRGGSAEYFNGLMSHFHYVDGSQLAPTVFGSTDSTTGEWKINTSPSYTVGTKGFFVLKDTNSGTDQSANSNNFTVGGGTLTKTEDNPSNVFDTINTNFAKTGGVNGRDSNIRIFIDNGATRLSTDVALWTTMLGSIPMFSGKYYWECKRTYEGSPSNHLARVGVEPLDTAGTSLGSPVGTNTNSVNYQSEGGGLKSNSSYSGTYASWQSNNDIVQIAVDMDNYFIYFGKNGTWQNSGDPTSGSSGTGGIALMAGKGYVNGFTVHRGGGSAGGDKSMLKMNFGNGYFQQTAVASAGTNASGLGIFEYDVPTGYTALCTKGLNE